MFSKFKIKNIGSDRFKNKGFTLIELLVVIAIASIITGVFVFKQNEWNDRLVLSTQAYELSLMIRQAQVYSLGVRENTLSSGDKFSGGYGVYFDSDHSKYVFFGDRNGDKKYDSGEEIETKYFTRGVSIDRFCGRKGVGQQEERCSPDDGNVNFAHISFFRPEPKADIFFENTGNGDSLNVVPPLIVYLISPKGQIISVKVETNGQIYVN